MKKNRCHLTSQTRLLNFLKDETCVSLYFVLFHLYNPVRQIVQISHFLAAVPFFLAFLFNDFFQLSMLSTSNSSLCSESQAKKINKIFKGDMKVRSLRRQPAVIGGTVYRSFSLTRSPEVIVLRNARRKEKKKISEIASGASRPKTVPPRSGKQV